MELKEFGIIIRDIRKQLLNITQNQLAAEVNSTQALLSRLENGKGSTPQLVFAVLKALREKNIRTHLIFVKSFEFANLLNRPMENSQLQKNQFVSFITTADAGKN